MWTKLAEVERRYDELAEQLSAPEIIKDRALFLKYSKEHKDLNEIVATLRGYKKAKEELEGSKELLNSAADAEMRSMAQEEVKLLQAELEGLEGRLTLLLLPKDPNDDKNVILEIRAGAGGDEASLFAAELFRLYTRYAENRGWKVELLNTSDGGAGGYKEVIGMITGQGAYSRFKYEKGVHRVQRVPATEAAGRTHTSTVTVAVLPEAEDVDVEVRESDLKIDVFRSGGPGGQSVNTTDSAVRMLHVPTGIVVVMRDEKSQHKNRDKALRVLKARILDKQQEELDSARRAERKSQVGTGERSEKIRTYNFPQSRVTDHRIGLSLYNLADVMNGELDQLLDPIVAHDQALKLKGEVGVGATMGADEDDA
jgi:peptide chain release factor 1